MLRSGIKSWVLEAEGVDFPEIHFPDWKTLQQTVAALIMRTCTAAAVAAQIESLNWPFTHSIGRRLLFVYQQSLVSLKSFTRLAPGLFGLFGLYVVSATAILKSHFGSFQGSLYLQFNFFLLGIGKSSPSGWTYLKVSVRRSRPGLPPGQALYVKTIKLSTLDPIR